MTVRDVSKEFDIDRVKDIPWKKEVSDRNAYTVRSVLCFFFGKISLLCRLRIAPPTLVVPIHIPKYLSVLQLHH
jgi:hypothetical protein